MDKRVSYGVMRPGFNTPVGRVMFRICKNWIGVVECGGVFGGVFGAVIVPKYLTPFVILFIEIPKKIFVIKSIPAAFYTHSIFCSSFDVFKTVGP